MKFEKKYNKQDILVLGYGVTGKSIVKFLRKQNVNIFVYDDNINFTYSKEVKLYNPNKKRLADFSVIFVSVGVLTLISSTYFSVSCDCINRPATS